MKRRSFLTLSAVALALSSVRGAWAQDAKSFKPEQLVYTGAFDTLEKEGFFAKLK